ncbi:MAG: hypothetical protein ACUVUG_00755 [Candidatus Aminicenantia bacterium]
MEKRKITFQLVKISGILITVIISISFLLFSLRPRLMYFKKLKDEMRKNELVIEKFNKDKELFHKDTEEEKILWKKVKNELEEKVKVLNSDEEIFSHFSTLIKNIKDLASSMGITQIMFHSQSKSFTININPNPQVPLFIKEIRDTGFENVEGEEDFGDPLGKVSYVGFKIIFISDIKTSATFIKNLPSIPNLLSIEKVDIYSQNSFPVCVLYVKFYYKRGRNV